MDLSYDPIPSAWHNEPSISGGGCWAVEAAHGIDTFLQFSRGRPITVVGAVMSNVMYGRPIEDTGVGMLRTDDGMTAIIETGYTYPSGARSGDQVFRFMGTKASVLERYDKQGDFVIEVHTTQGVTFHKDTSHRTRFKAVMDAALGAVEAGHSFVPNIGDAVRILEVQDAVYDQARANPLTNGPHAMGAAPVKP